MVLSRCEWTRIENAEPPVGSLLVVRYRQMYGSKTALACRDLDGKYYLDHSNAEVKPTEWIEVPL